MVEGLIGSYFGNFLTVGNSGNDMQFGGAVGDTLRGDIGDDSLFGSGGADTLEGGTGNDNFTQVDATHWSINSLDGLARDVLTIANAASFHVNDYSLSLREIDDAPVICDVDSTKFAEFAPGPALTAAAFIIL